MYQSIESELTTLRDQLGPSPLTDIFEGLHHVHYQVAPRQGLPLVKDYLRKTNYKLAGAFFHKERKTNYYLMTLEHNPIGIVIEENRDSSLKFPRLTSLAFKMKEIKTVKDTLNKFDVSFKENFLGLVTHPITGFGDAFAFTIYDGYEWFDSDEFEPKKIDTVKINFDTVSQPYLNKIGGIDHIAYRIQLDGVKTAATNLMRFTGYRFSDCYTIGTENAETMVFRWGDTKPAIVASYGWDRSAVVWQYVAKYGFRVHHTAFYTENVLDVIDFQQQQQIEFTTEKIIGSKDRGILQIFTTPSPYSHEITEYIERFHGFTGFFDKGNVGDLMKSTKSFNE